MNSIITLVEVEYQDRDYMVEVEVEFHLGQSLPKTWEAPGEPGELAIIAIEPMDVLLDGNSVGDEDVRLAVIAECKRLAKRGRLDDILESRCADA